MLWSYIPPAPEEDHNLGKLGFSLHPISSGPSSLAHMFFRFPFVLIIFMKTPLRKSRQHHFELSCAHRFVKSVLCLIRLLASTCSTFTAEQVLSFTTWPVTKPQGGLRSFLKQKSFLRVENIAVTTLLSDQHEIILQNQLLSI